MWGRHIAVPSLQSRREPCFARPLPVLEAGFDVSAQELHYYLNAVSGPSGRASALPLHNPNLHTVMNLCAGLSVCFSDRATRIFSGSRMSPRGLKTAKIKGLGASAVLRGGWCDRREGAVSDGGVTPRTYPIPPCFALGIMIDPVGTSASPVLNDASVTRREVIWAASSPQVWPEGLLQSYVAEV